MDMYVRWFKEGKKIDRYGRAGYPKIEYK